MSREVTFDSLVGVWRRRSIRWPDGKEDLSTRVWWLQAKARFADIRIPAGRPSFTGTSSWEQCNQIQRAWLQKQEGFAGILAQENDAWLWKRELDFAPVPGRRDIGRLRFTDDYCTQMIEDGVDESYVEIWEREVGQESVSVQSTVMRLDQAGLRGLLVVVGPQFLMALERQGAPSLELSRGERSGAICGWVVRDSTLPWREGERLLAGMPDQRCWRIEESDGRTPEWLG